MISVLLPFATYLEQAEARLERAESRDHIERILSHDDGVLRGYYLAGAVSAVEFQAARNMLRRAYNQKLGMIDLQTGWREYERESLS